MYTSVLDYLERTAKCFPNKVVYRDQSESITFNGIRKKAKAIASVLLEKTPVRQPVVVITEKRIADITAFLGVVYAGCYYVPIDIQLPRERINSIIESVNPQLVLCSAANTQILSSTEFRGENILYEDLENKPIQESALQTIRRGLCDVDPLYLIFTSGSTGTAKGVLTSHRSVIDYVDSFCEVVNVNETDVLGSQASLDYVAAIRDIYIPLKTGASTVLIERRLFSTPSELFLLLNEHKITTLCWASTALSLVVAFKTFDSVKLKSVSKVVFTGSVLPCSDLSVWQKNLPKAFFMNQYGPTEITASCTYYIVDYMVTSAETLPIGVPFKNTRILLLSEQGGPVPQGELGEICVGGSCLALGYFRNYELTKKSFVKNPLNHIYPEIIYKTGDIGSFDENGNLWFHGRNDTQIKHMGYRIELSEIEQSASAIDGISSCACLYDSAHANIYLFYEGTVDRRDIALELRKKLPGYMVPKKFVYLETLPRTQNGKVNLKKLKEYFQ